MFTYEYQIQQGSELLSLYPDISKLFYAKTNTTGNIFFCCGGNYAQNWFLILKMPDQ